jgi:hypothetical protein
MIIIIAMINILTISDDRSSRFNAPALFFGLLVFVRQGNVLKNMHPTVGLHGHRLELVVTQQQHLFIGCGSDRLLEVVVDFGLSVIVRSRPESESESELGSSVAVESGSSVVVTVVGRGSRLKIKKILNKIG